MVKGPFSLFSDLCAVYIHFTYSRSYDVESKSLLSLRETGLHLGVGIPHERHTLPCLLIHIFFAFANIVNAVRGSLH